MMMKLRISFRIICSECPEFVDKLDLGSEVKQNKSPMFGLEFWGVWWCHLLRQERLQVEHFWGNWF